MGGHERIPENWYKRAIAYPYELDYFNADVLKAAALHPEFLDVGGNLGCFAYQLSTTAKPDLLLGLLDPVTDLVGDVVSQLSCPKLNQVDEDLLKQFPGYRQ